MIAANEARVGNWLLNFMEEPFRVNSTTIEVLSINGVGVGFPLPTAIPLTSDILEKAGFVYRENSNNRFWNKSVYSATFRLWVFDDKFFFSPFETNYEKEIQYLHQLQNLFYALTGEELQIEL